MRFKMWRLKGCVNMFRTYFSMHYFIAINGLFDEFMEFDKDFDWDKIDDIKQELRKKRKEK